MIKSDYIVLDTETGGLDKYANPMTQFAAVILDGVTLKEVDRWETYIKPYCDLKIEDEALKHTFVSMTDIKAGVKLDLWAKTFVSFCKQHQHTAKSKEMGRLVIVGHNIPFDIGFIKVALMLAGYDEIYDDLIFPNFIDTFDLAKMMWGVGKDRDEKLNLSACCERAGIKITDAHGAMNDVEATSALFKYFIKKLRANKGGSSEDTAERARGDEFFEFKCGVK